MSRHRPKQSRVLEPTPSPIVTPEREDLLTLLACWFLIPLTWMILFGWRLHAAIGNHDALANHFPYMQDFVKHGWSWKSALYRLDLMGGIKVHDVMGTLPIQELAALLGFSANSTLNLIAIFAQACYAFLGVRAATDLCRLWRTDTEPFSLSWGARLGLILLFAFTPILGWKLSYGHVIMVLGSFAYLSFIALWLGARLGRSTWTLTAVALAACLNCFPSTGQQALFYSVVFGGPVMLGLVLSQPADARTEARSLLRSFVLPCLVILGAFALTMPEFSGMLAHATSSDAARSLHGESVTFSYIQGRMIDWISSIPWAVDLISSGRESFLLHETNNPFGPALLLLFLLPWRRARPLVIGALSSAALAILFSLNIHWINTVFETLLPPIKNFRVPERAILPFCFTLPILAAAGLLYRFSGRGLWQRLRGSAALVPVLSALAVACAAVYLLPVDAREILTWLAAAAAVGFAYWRSSLAASVPAATLLLVFAFSSASAFRERLLPFPDPDALVARFLPLKQQALTLAPELRSPLTRVKLNFDIPGIQVNSAYALGLSTIDGYWAAPRRFIELVLALDGLAFMPTAVNFNITEGDVAFPVLQQLYNVEYSIDQSRTANSMGLRHLSPTPGEAWFVQSLRSTQTFADLARELHSSGPSLRDRLAHEGWVVATDPVIRKLGIREGGNPACASSRVNAANAPRGGQSIELEIQNQADCTLVVAANFAEDLRARALPDGKTLRLFPVFGSLIGVDVPAGTSRISIEAVPMLPLWARLVGWLGLVLAALAFYFSKRPLVTSAAPSTDQPSSTP